MFQLILPFQLELPFDGARGGASRASGAGEREGRSKLASGRDSAVRAKRVRRDRRCDPSHSLELPLLAEPAILEADA